VTITVAFTDHTWWLSDWRENRVVCALTVEHASAPTSGEVLTGCGQDVYGQWVDTEPCQAEEVTQCVGLYLHSVDSTSGVREIVVDLPPATVWISLKDCSSAAPEEGCESLPTLLLTAREPLPNMLILGVHGTLDGVRFDCEEPECEVPLRRTPPEGVRLVFWADSTFGDSSEVYEALVRAVPAVGVEYVPSGWQIDVLSPQWRGSPLASCAVAWQAFPPGELPTWLATPENPESLRSDVPYIYLAGNLIRRGEVDALECPDAGLGENGAANPCGLEKAIPEVDTWQNRFDVTILEAAGETGIPARLMKNLFAHESQFWPGILNNPSEAGLGQLTENGADTTLLWNRRFFDAFCPLVFYADTCGRGYVGLKSAERAILRGALFTRANAECESCPEGIDLRQADFSVGVFAETLLANCRQVGQIVRNTIRHSPGEIASYEDLWRLTLVNYHAGPGCLGRTLEGMRPRPRRLVWAEVAEAMPAECESGVGYVEAIARP
jgi:hypothetical protein